MEKQTISFDKPVLNQRICWVGAYKGEHCLGRYVVNTFKELGYTVDVIDYRENMDRLNELFERVNADLVIVSRGGGIHPKLIDSLQCPTILWFGEYMHGNDDHSRDRIRELRYNGWIFDYVVWGAEKNNETMQIMRNNGCSRVGYAYPCRFDPKIYRKMDLPKIYDVSFVGSITPRRKQILEILAKRFKVEVRNIWDLEEQVRFFNQSRIVLHINSFDFINIAGVNLRAFDVLGAGSFMLHEDLIYPRVFDNEFTDKKHLSFWRYNDVNDLIKKIDYYLIHEEEREKITQEGYSFVHSNFSVEKTVHELIKRVDFELNAPSLNGPGFGASFDKWGRQTYSQNELIKNLELQLSPEYSQTYYCIGENYYTISMYDKASKALEKAIDMDGNYVKAMYLLALCYQKMNKPEKAIRELKRLLNIVPLHHQANQTLGEIYTEQGEEPGLGQYYKLKGEKLSKHPLHIN
jgi:spore maturation protein CgeB